MKLSPHQDQGAGGDAQGVTVHPMTEEAYNGMVPQLRILGRGGQPTLPSLYWGFPAQEQHRCSLTANILRALNVRTADVLKLTCD